MFSNMKQKILVSKSQDTSKKDSANKTKLKLRGYAPMDELLKFAHRMRKGKPMGANEDDKIIYDIE